MAALLIAKVEVEDFDTWKANFEAPAGVEFRDGAGIKHASIYRKPGHPTSVAVFHRFDSVEEAEAFIANPQLAEVMKASGVVGAPHVEIYEAE